MEQYYLCGKQAVHPLVLEDVGLSLYSAEELCYYIVQYLPLLPERFIDERLIAFLRDELGLKELADRLGRQFTAPADRDTGLLAILRDVAFLEEGEISRFRDALAKAKKTPRQERLKLRGDLLLARGRCESAVRSYSQILLLKRDNRLDNAFYAATLQHMGAAYQRMGYDSEAMECFQASFAESGSEAVLEQMFYLSMVSGMPFPKELEQVESAQIARWESRYFQTESGSQYEAEQQGQETDLQDIPRLYAEEKEQLQRLIG